MKGFRWILLNIQISAYIETLYWTLCFGPYIYPYSLVLLTPLGLNNTWLHIPGNYTCALAVILHGCIDGSMILGMFYRYWILLPMINIRVHWFYYVALPILHYIVGGCGCGICAVYSILDDESTEALFLEKVPNTPYPEGSVTLGGPGIIIWACILIACLSFGSVAVSFVLTHSAIIINKSSTSKQTKSQHRSAIYSLIIQMVACFSCSLLPLSVYAYQLLLGRESDSWDYLDWAMPICLPHISMKAIACSLTCILTITPYRRWVFKRLGIIKQKTASSLVVSDHISGISTVQPRPSSSWR